MAGLLVGNVMTMYVIFKNDHWVGADKVRTIKDE